MSDYKWPMEEDECFLDELRCRFAIRALLLNEDTLLQVGNFFPCIMSLSFGKAIHIVKAIFLGMNLVLELCN